VDESLLVEGITMSVSTGGDANQGPARQAPEGGPALEQLDVAECMRLISPGGIGRIAYAGRYGLTVLPVNYVLHEGAVLFRTSQDSATAEDLQTGIANAEYQAAFEIDDIDPVAREGWSVLIQGPAHQMTTEAERASVAESGVEPWPGGPREHAIRITPTRVTGRRLRQG
jgi:nitroimidazol reductase NimA-like FMN-containing flavoprotein (pyridoxamine 5'-phosphate oxidase superfamily)